MKLLNFGILAALAVSAMALAQPDRGQNNNAPGRRMRQRKVPVGQVQNGRSGRGKKIRAKARRAGGRSNQDRQKPRRFKLGTRKHLSAKRASLRKIPAKVRKQRSRGRNSNQARDQGYYYGSSYYYYTDYATGATPTGYTYATYTDSPVGQSGPTEAPVTPGGVEDCFKVTPTIRVGYWDDVADFTESLSQMSGNDIKAIQKEGMTKTYGETGRFLMEDGGTTSYETKSHSLIVSEICPGQGSGRRRSGGAGRRNGRQNGRNRRRNKQD